MRPIHPCPISTAFRDSVSRISYMALDYVKECLGLSVQAMPVSAWQLLCAIKVLRINKQERKVLSTNFS